MTLEHRLEAHRSGLEGIIKAKEQRTIENVVAFFKNSFTADNIQKKDDEFWNTAYNNLLSGLFDVFVYQRHTQPELQVVHDIPEYLTEVYRQKNTDYGDSFSESMDEFGLYASVVRLSDKINRLEQLGVNKEEINVADEKLEDTLLDAINYTQMTITYMNE